VTMASGPTKTKPVCLVENQEEQLMVNPEALQILYEVSQPVVVVAIAGLYRTGKSYLMNLLAGQNHGFRLGSTVRSETKGIWMWCIPHPTKLNHTLILLDTEGLGDVKKGDPKNDSWIFALTVLLSSTLIYNSMNTINHQALEQLQYPSRNQTTEFFILTYVTELTELIRAKSSSTPDKVKDSIEFVSFFPDFVWTVRDFTLEMKIDDLPITEDEYLEDALKLIPGKNPRVQNSNMPRECIREFFPNRKCFIFDRPTSDKNLLFHIENVLEEHLDSSFRVQSKKFRSYILDNSRTKTLREGIIVTGNRLGALVEAYVNAIKSGVVPCLENAVTTLAERENSVAVQKAVNHYGEQMTQEVSLPTDTLQELLKRHGDYEREAIAVFIENSFRDDERKFQKKLVEAIEEKKEYFLQQNEDASVKYCQAMLKQLSKPLMESIKEKTFFVSGGHELYLEAKKKVELGYELVPRKGVKANEVLQGFLQSQATVEEYILHSDNALTAQEKAIAVERTKKEAAEKEQERLKQKENEQQQKLEAQERSFKENLAQLQEKIKKEQERLREMLEKILDHYLRVQEELLNEKFKKKSHELAMEISRLRKEIEETKNNDSWMLKAIEMAGNVLIIALPEIFKLFYGEQKILD
ncbi:hypothetical protein MC885_011080, partial [Smutsia gigantea]